MTGKPEISIHPSAAIFPMLPDEEIAELGESIKKFGLREKIQAVAIAGPDKTDWLVIDGRNRLEALRRILGLDDATIIADFMVTVNLDRIHATPAEYVMMANIERRNLTAQQRRDLAGKLAIMIEEQQRDKPREERVDSLTEAAKKAGVSRRTAATAKQDELKKGGKAKTPAKKAPKKKVTSIWQRPAPTLGTLQTMAKELTVKVMQGWTIKEIQDVHAAAVTLSEVVAIMLKKDDKPAA